MDSLMAQAIPDVTVRNPACMFRRGGLQWISDPVRTAFSLAVMFYSFPNKLGASVGCLQGVHRWQDCLWDMAIYSVEPPVPYRVRPCVVGKEEADLVGLTVKQVNAILSEIERAVPPQR